MDARALGSYRRRLAELDAELERAEERHDPGPRERLLGERESLLEEIHEATSIGGRPRSFSDERERARKAVSARLHQSVATLRGLHPELGEHLERSVTIGIRCSYAPHPPVSWET